MELSHDHQSLLWVEEGLLEVYPSPVDSLTSFTLPADFQCSEVTRLKNECLAKHGDLAPRITASLRSAWAT